MPPRRHEPPAGPALRPWMLRSGRTSPPLLRMGPLGRPVFNASRKKASREPAGRPAATFPGTMTAELTTSPALAAVLSTGVPHRVVRTGAANSAEEAAALQGIPLGALLRTIVVR